MMTQTYKEMYRPQFHFSPEEKWMNDPNGMVYFNDEYHLFYQYHPLWYDLGTHALGTCS